MNELRTAIEGQKKTYIFIADDVYIENRTYLINKDRGTFMSAYTDDLAIHDFIAELKSGLSNNIIVSFNTTDQIIDTLRAQFAGLFHSYLKAEEIASTAQVIGNLEKAIGEINDAVDVFRRTGTAFWGRFQSTNLATNSTLLVIQKKLGLKSAPFYAENIKALDEILIFAGYQKVECDDSDDQRKYVKDDGVSQKILILKNGLFNDDGTFKDISSEFAVEDMMSFEENLAK